MPHTDIEERLSAVAGRVEHFLGQLLSTEDGDLVSLYASMRYSTLAGGKRIRPFLVMETARVLGAEARNAVYLAAALEMIHTYSLIHDDLPAMDDDDLRRGKPTNHKVYGEAMAILAGDALLTGAFQILCAAHLPDGAVRRAVRVLSEAAGADGMVGGQVMDLAAEGKEIDFESLVKLCSLKTGALMEAAVTLGMIAAGVEDESIRRAFVTYARYIGLAFQIVDDVLDRTGSAEELGKSVGSDEKEHKTTFLSFLGVEEAMAYARRLTEGAREAIGGIEGTEGLLLLADYLIERKK